MCDNGIYIYEVYLGYETENKLFLTLKGWLE